MKQGKSGFGRTCAISGDLLFLVETLYYALILKNLMRGIEIINRKK